MVRYQIQRESSAVQVETQFRNWTTANNLYYPQTIERLENGSEVFTISLSALTFSSARSDSIFADPSN